MSALRGGGLAQLGLCIVAGLVALIAAGPSAIFSVLAGVGAGTLLMSLTALSVLWANRFRQSAGYLAIFFGLVLGGWLVKFVAFIGLMMLLRPLGWVNPMALLASLVVSIAVALATDLVIVIRSRMPYISDPRSRSI